ncbi:hypothetical protein ANDO1_0569 [plant metagenome]|uniref:Uncharacterized protein n=1 Tax=plant metagenome TaxID=1297885 RepID=A0A484PZ71_9ZZZZ
MQAGSRTPAKRRRRHRSVTCPGEQPGPARLTPTTPLRQKKDTATKTKGRDKVPAYQGCRGAGFAGPPAPPP